MFAAVSDMAKPPTTLFSAVSSRLKLAIAPVITPFFPVIELMWPTRFEAVEVPAQHVRLSRDPEPAGDPVERRLID